MSIILSEPAWQRLVIAIARVNGWQVGRSTSAHSDPGIPDLTLIHPDGRVMFVELKVDGGRTTGPQRRVLRAIEAAGVEVHLWRPEDRREVEAVLGGQALPVETATTIEAIVDAVAASYRIPTFDLTGPGQTGRLTRARWVAMAVVRELTGASLPRIGEVFNRNHTTVLHGLRRLTTDAALVQARDRLCAELSTGQAPAPTGRMADCAEPSTA